MWIYHKLEFTDLDLPPEIRTGDINKTKNTDKQKGIRYS
jgi:hypothetical protein